MLLYKNSIYRSFRITSLRENGILKTDSKEKANICNRQFQSAFTREDDSDPPSKGASPFSSMGDITVDPKRVTKLLDGLNVHKASGPDGLNARVLKECSNEISPILALIYNESLARGEVPDELRSSNTESSAVNENIKKARRTLYSLMPSGCHGNNGQDPETTIHLLQTYILPILVYGMEVVLPRGKHLDCLEKFYKKYLKLLLSIPVTTADPAVYILFGTVPIEATIHKRALILFGNITRLAPESVEKQVAYRQLSIKGHKSNSWFVAIREICFKYELIHPLELLQDPPRKETWKRTVNKQVNGYWSDRIRSNALLYSSLHYLQVADYQYGKRHPVLQTIGNAREIPRIAIKLKLVTGMYILQTNRAAFNQNQIKSTCLLCNTEDETMEHFLLSCTALHSVRQPILDIIKESLTTLHEAQLVRTTSDLLQIVLDCSALYHVIPKCNHHLLEAIEFHSRRFCYKLHCERYKRLALVPQRTRKKKTNA